MIVLPCETLPSSGPVASYFWPPSVQKPVRFSPIGSQQSKKGKSGRTIAHTGHLPHDPKKLLPSPSVLQPVLAPGCKLPMCSSWGLCSLPAWSSCHTGRITFNETPFCTSKKCFLEAPVAAFVAAAERPSSGRVWKSAHHLPREQPPIQKVARIHQAF